jgi:hypothetical protein
LLFLLFVCFALGNDALSFDRYVDLNSTNPVTPYITWETAATTIQDAVDVAGNGDTVFVSRGTYDSGSTLAGNWASRVVINENITVRSVNGTVVIDGGGSNRCVYLNGGRLLNLTLTSGYADIGGGAYVTNGILENCVFRDNRAARGSIGETYSSGEPGGDGGWGGGVYMTSGEINRCTFYSNQAGDGGFGCVNAVGGHGGHGGGLYMKDGILNRCMFESNRAGNGGEGGAGLDGEDGNWEEDGDDGGNGAAGGNGGDGGGVYLEAGMMNNCVFIDNRAGYGMDGGGGGYGGDGGSSPHPGDGGDGGDGSTGGDGGDGGGVYLAAGVLNNCTFSGNRIRVGGAGGSRGWGGEGGEGTSGAYYGEPGSDGNGGVNGIDGKGDGAYLAGGVLNNCISGDPVDVDGGIINDSYIGDDPGFMDPEFPWLKANSPGINAGNNGAVQGTTDFYGNPRIINGTVDMGAFEYFYDEDNFDGDAFSNGEEAIAGTDPNDCRSVFKVEMNGSQLNWTAATNRIYTVECSTNLVDGFHYLKTITNSTGVLNITNALDHCYYRFNVKLR